MKRILSLIFIVISLVGLSGCTYVNVQGDPQYVELYPSRNSGWYVNYKQPIFVANDSVLINLLPDYRFTGDWLVSLDETKDTKFTLSKNNYIYIEDQLIGEWYWGTTNTLVIDLYATDTLSESTNALRIDFIDNTDDFAQFTEYYGDGSYDTFLGVRVDQ